MATTRAVMRDARTMVRRISQRIRTASGVTVSTLTRARQQLQQLVTHILDQTRARLLGGDIHVPDKVLSIVEPHTEAIRKGKIAKPTAFGKLVTIQESEHQIITADQVHDRRPPETTLWTPALDRPLCRCLIDHPTSRRAIADSRRSPMKPRRSRAGCGGSSCRDPVARRPRGARMNASAGFVEGSAGPSAARGASASLNGATACGAVAIEVLTAPLDGSGSA